jgi:hypothetical protein
MWLHGIGANSNPATLTLDGLAPTATTAKYKDSPAVKFSGGNTWVEIGTWTASPKLTSGTLTSLADLELWLGLKNSDDIGTNFDLRADVYKNGVLITSGETDCISGLTRNPALAMAVGIPFKAFKPVTFDGGKEALSLKLSTRIGTNGSGGPCGGHASAVGLRTYFDADLDASMFSTNFAGGETATVNVTVIEENTNAPIPGATVTLTYVGKPPKGKNPPGVTTGTTDGNGEVQFVDQLIGVFAEIRAVVNDGTNRQQGLKVPAGFIAGENAFILAVAPVTTGSISGVVSDASSGASLSHVQISLLNDQNALIYSTGTLADGSYSMVEVLPGTYHILFELAGYNSSTVSGVVVVIGSNTVQDAHLTALPPPVAAVSVTVIEQTTQAPIPRTTVSLNYTIVPPNGDQHPFGLTDGTGTILFDSQSSHIEADIVATLNDGSGRVASLNVPGGFVGGTNTFVLAVPPAATGSLSGVVTDATTSGTLAGVQVVVLDANNNTLASTVTGSDGSYAIGGVFVGTLSMTFSLTGYQVGSVSGVLVSANANTLVNEELQPVPNPSNANVDITVLDSQTDAGFAGAEVTITYTHGSLPAIAQTDANGVVNFSNQLIGVSATISVNDPGSGRSASLPVPGGFIPGTNPLITIRL